MHQTDPGSWIAAAALADASVSHITTSTIVHVYRRAGVSKCSIYAPTVLEMSRTRTEHGLLKDWDVLDRFKLVKFRGFADFAKGASKLWNSYITNRIILLYMDYMHIIQYIII